MLILRNEKQLYTYAGTGALSAKRGQYTLAYILMG